MNFKLTVYFDGLKWAESDSVSARLSQCCRSPSSFVAQWIERPTADRKVMGSISMWALANLFCFFFFFLSLSLFHFSHFIVELKI